MSVEVTEVSSVEEILGVRAAVLRPGQAVVAARNPQDGEAGAIHVCAVVEGRIVGCGSLYPAKYREMEAQRIRGMAVLEGFRSQGVGSLILEALKERAIFRGVGRLVWLNARVRAIPFYERAGFVGVGEIFSIEGIGPHRLMIFRW